MDALMWLVSPQETDWFTRVTGILTALGAIGAAVAATWLLVYASRQAQEMIEARYDQSRPLVLPTSDPPMRGPGQGYNQEWFDPDVPPDRPVFRNIGPGPALNVWAVIFGPRPDGPVHELARRRTAIVGVPIPAGEERDADSAVGRTVLDGNTTLDGNPEHTLYAPAEPTQGDVIARDTVLILARYTITYHDIFGRRHASIFDFDFLHKRRCVGFILNIPKDLEEVNRERHTARMEVVTNPAHYGPRVPTDDSVG